MTPEQLAQQRTQWRTQLLDARKTIPAAQRAAADATLDARLRTLLNTIDAGVLAFYWPMQSEFDARPAVTGWLAAGGGRHAVLPVVMAKHQPLQFRAWTPRTVMQAAGFGTSVPSTGEWLVPTVLLIPLVGYDDAGYRLGYGGGFYDRTLAALHPQPRSIGIGYASGSLATIHPQTYDLKLDAILTH